jgi:death-on-curing protein
VKIRTLSLPEVLFIHSAIIDESGGSHGVRDEGLLQSAVHRVQQTFDGKDLYPSVIDKAAALFLGLLKNHPFVDGNKRTAVTALGVFLGNNSIDLKADPEDLAAWVQKAAASPLNQKTATSWIRAHTAKRF